MKYFQIYHRFNYKFDPPLEERLCVWLEWNEILEDENLHTFADAMNKAMWEQCTKSWKSEWMTQSQDENIEQGNAHSPELDWSSVMQCGHSFKDHATHGKFKTPIYKG